MKRCMLAWSQQITGSVQAELGGGFHWSCDQTQESWRKQQWGWGLGRVEAALCRCDFRYKPEERRCCAEVQPQWECYTMVGTLQVGHRSSHHLLDLALQCSQQAVTFILDL